MLIQENPLIDKATPKTQGPAALACISYRPLLLSTRKAVKTCYIAVCVLVILSELKTFAQVDTRLVTTP